MSDLRRYNLKYEDALKHINFLLELNGGYYRGVHIRCVAIAQDGTWRNAICLVRVLPTETSRMPPASRRYSKVLLLESYLDLSYLGQLIREMPTGKLTIDGESVYVGERPEFHSWELQASTNDYADFPGYLYQSSNSSLTSALPQEPLVGFNLPHYPDTYHAIREWIKLRQSHGLTDARIGYVWLFLPECRARFQKLDTSGTSVTIAIALGAYHTEHKFHVTGSWETASGLVPISLPVSNGTISVEIPDGATSVSLYLMDQTDTIFDYHQETVFWNLGQGRILSSARETGGEPLETGDEDLEETLPKRVFIVHGRDEANTLRLERMLRQEFGLEPVILRYQAGKGRTLIEKFEEEAKRCVFAFALVGPDDQVEVPAKGGVENYLQARPNVLFELGWFYGRLGRGRVCILYKRGTKIHSDLDGVSRIEFEENVEKSFSEIRRELVAAGLIVSP